MAKRSTPGVYIEEVSAFPNGVAPVATAVPAFIGYTEIALRDNKNLRNQPLRISSFGEYVLYFGGAPKTLFDLKASSGAYALETRANSRFLLYHSMKLFFDNGGSDCYIVSIGDYHAPPALLDFDDDGKGLQTLRKEPEPTLVVIPDAVLLGESDRGILQQKMLAHCHNMTSCFAILDVFMDENAKDKPNTPDLISRFRTAIGVNYLQWGAAYYPWLHTNIPEAGSVDFTNLHPESFDCLVELLKEEVATRKSNGLAGKSQAVAIRLEIDKIPTVTSADVKTLHQTLLAISSRYKTIMSSILEKINLLPPSGAIAGIYCMVDNTVGVFQSPANVSLGSVTQPAVNLTNDEQEDMNVPLNGKAVNAIRTFPGKGVLIWGARTLDGNSQDWRYVSVRRTVISIEQSIKYATEPYVFAPNTFDTWTKVKAMISNFLTSAWQSGALAGSAPEDAFSVDVGLGTTMTPVDILDGIMRITVKIAVTRPAEFIVITFQQKMQQS